MTNIKGPESYSSPAVPAIVRELSGSVEARLVWINERGGMTFRAGNRFVKWNPHANGLDLEAERAVQTFEGSNRKLPD